MSAPGEKRRETPRRSGAAWLAGAGLLAVLALVVLNFARPDASGGGDRVEVRGAQGLPVGARLPPFAAPLAASELDGDANVARRGASGGGRPACEVRGPDVLNVCALAERGPVVLAFVAARPARCLEQLDVLDQVARALPGVGFAAIAVSGDRDAVREDVRRGGWDTPVGHDRDGAVAALYGVGVCPTVVFARRGGVVAGVALGRVGAQELRRRARGLR